MPHIVAGPVAELAPGERKLIPHGTVAIGVFNIGGEFVAVRSQCPHHGAPVCLGQLGGTVVGQVAGTLSYENDGQVLACPWHHWQFDLTTGQCLTNPKWRLRRYETTVENGQIIVHI